MPGFSGLSNQSLERSLRLGSLGAPPVVLMILSPRPPRGVA
jgi:hypothetical protein